MWDRIQYMSNIGFNIKQIRLAKGWSQKELGQRAGVSQGTIGHLESGRNQSSTELPAIAHALGTSVEALTGRELAPPPPSPTPAPGEGELAHADASGSRSSGVALRIAPAVLDYGHAQDPTAWRDAVFVMPDEKAFLWRVADGTMAPRYQQGEYALVEPSLEPDIEDDVLVVLKNGDARLCRLTSKRGGMRVGSFASHETRTYDESDIAYLFYVSHPVPARKVMICE